MAPGESLNVELNNSKDEKKCSRQNWQGPSARAARAAELPAPHCTARCAEPSLETTQFQARKMWDLQTSRPGDRSCVTEWWQRGWPDRWLFQLFWSKGLNQMNMVTICSPMGWIVCIPSSVHLEDQPAAQPRTVSDPGADKKAKSRGLLKEKGCVLQQSTESRYSCLNAQKALEENT